MTVAPPYRDRTGAVSVRVCIIVLIALVFGQFASASHAHDSHGAHGHHHEEAPVICDICISPVPDDDDEAWMMADDQPQTKLGMDNIPTSLRLPGGVKSPAFLAHRSASGTRDKGRSQTRRTRAPPF
ncbi:MAG: hypothetical protein WBA35_04535 [Litorimonas sp.]